MKPTNKLYTAITAISTACATTPSGSPTQMEPSVPVQCEADALFHQVYENGKQFSRRYGVRAESNFGPTNNTGECAAVAATNFGQSIPEEVMHNQRKRILEVLFCNSTGLMYGWEANVAEGTSFKDAYWRSYRAKCECEGTELVSTSVITSPRFENESQKSLDGLFRDRAIRDLLQESEKGIK